ncbi:PEP/pyruvate-binding domain-containing protein [Nonomuraea endophytica]|uniref:Pyruvate,water dikinase n=1 Tax=Nonomuraea endophytica TaxID=714136 RepID=A0A7W8ELR6_9ACTN|nr:PEP/pyruvate-binding domain-containing protein [Nonomuraea endophytica]MBB5084189.1 pyruvate,water dikinase [Nonomuraea endophytica]
MNVLPLDDAAADLAVAGGKGASLARLSRAGLPVPPGFHITTDAYRAFTAPFRERLGAPGAQELFTTHEIPPDLAAEILAAHADLGDGDGDGAVAVAVRSSATAEDLPEMSFAGQQDSYLNVHREDLLDAVRRCWASLWNPRAVAYRERNHVPHDDVALAVVVQELVDADAAGVMFTADPVTGARGQSVVNAAWGLGEAVVGGQVTPDAAVVADGRVRSYTVADKAVMTVREPEGTREREVPAARRSVRVLSDEEVLRLAALGEEIQRLYGTPMDVEWARRGEELFVVQARPITGLAEEVEEWNDSRTGQYLWTSGNLGEAIPDVMTPVTWSLVRLFIREAMSASAIPGYRLVGNIGGRFYLNLSIAISAAKAFGMSSRLGAIEQVFGKIPSGLDVPLLPASRWQLIKAMLPMAVGLRRRVAANVKRLRPFLATARSRCEELRERAGLISEPAALAAFWEEELRPYVVETCRMLEAAGRQGGAALVMTRDKLRKMVGESDAEAMLTGANAGGELASMGPIIGLDKLARGEIDRAEFAAVYGHRGAHEFEVSVPRPGEDPGWIDRQLAEVASGDARDLLARQEEARAAAWARFDRRYPRRGAAMRERVDRWNAIVRDREDARSENMRVFWAMRAFVLRAGELTGLGDDVFSLEIDEILDVLRGDRSPLAKIPVRRATYRKYAALPIYPMLIVGPFDPVRWAASPDRRVDLYDARGGQAPPADTVSGFPGAPGVVEGVARVLSGPEQGERLKAGEILVTTLTNIGWTPMFPRAAAVVTDMGAPLSHASIVARELGIPAVVGTGNATARIHDGDRIRVDGERGTVEVLN